jgi:hypothetical protein
MSISQFPIALATYSTLVDDQSTTVYVGKAIVGSSEVAAVWQIKKVLTAGASTKVLWANGSASFTNLWANRTSLTYTT